MNDNDLGCEHINGLTIRNFKAFLNGFLTFIKIKNINSNRGKLSDFNESDLAMIILPLHHSTLFHVPL